MTAAECFFWEKDFCIPSKTEAGHAIMDGILLQLQDYEWEQKDIFAIHLSFEEALVNAIRHGNQSENRLGVMVHLEISPERFLARIQDEGPGFNPDDIPDPTLDDFLERPCGRGVKLMRSFMTSVSFNPKGNVVTLEKLRSTPVPERFCVQEKKDETPVPSEPLQQEPDEASDETPQQVSDVTPALNDVLNETPQDARHETESQDDQDDVSSL